MKMLRILLVQFVLKTQQLQYPTHITIIIPILNQPSSKT